MVLLASVIYKPAGSCELTKSKKRVLFVSAGFLLLTGVCLVTGKSVYETSRIDTTSALRTVSSGNEKFSFDLLKAIGSKDENLVASPLSLHVALGFLSQGAKGTTKQQILKATHLPTDDDVTRAGFQALLEPMRSTSNYTLDLGDAAFVEKTFPLTTTFQNVARTSFKAETQSLDFINNASGAIKTINQWAEKKTHGLIKDLFSSSDVDSTTRFTLVNTLYFKGAWEHGFDASNTKKMDFHISSTTTVQTDMMTKTGAFNFTVNNDLSAKVIALDYKGGEARMLIVLPNQVEGLAAVESRITSLDQIKADLSPEIVELTLPKFKLEQEQQYIPILQKLGITTVFSAEADLRGISEAGQVSVSKVKQKAIIEVNESGTIAAAATGISGGATSVLTHEFKVDHGFLYFLEHIPTSSIIMYGRYMKP